MARIESKRSPIPTLAEVEAALGEPARTWPKRCYDHFGPAHPVLYRAIAAAGFAAAVPIDNWRRAKRQRPELFEAAEK